MVWTLRDQEFRAVIALPAPARYAYCIKHIADEEQLWGLWSDGWAMVGAEGGEQAIPVWPHARFAEASAIDVFAGHEPRAIPLADWLERWLPGMARLDLIGAFALTEPDHGSDAVTLETRARHLGDGYVLDGAKRWIGNGTFADLVVVWARDVADDKVKGFVVERGTSGFSATKIENKIALRIVQNADITLSGCRVPEANRLPEATSLRAPLSCLNEARFGIVFGAAGAARACYEAALDYAKTRVQFDKPIAGYQLTQAKLADMAVKVGNSTMLALHLGRMKDAGTLTPQHVSYGKFHNVSTAMDVARTARTILGANGVTLEYPVLRHANNLESVLTYEGTHEMHTLILGQAITGLPAFT